MKRKEQKWKTLQFTALFIAVFMLCVFFLTTNTIASTTKNVVYTAATKSNSDTSGDGSMENPYNRFEDAVANVADGGTIYILSSSGAFLNAQENDMPFVINKEITIEPEPGADHAALVSRSAGILLGADVTFNNIELDFAYSYHDQVFANGHNLTMINVSRSSSHRIIDLVAGGLYDTNGYRIGPEPAKKGTILIQGKCEFGNIYAGSINGIYDGDTAIHVQEAKGAVLGEIYASGAKEAEYDRNNWFDLDEPPAPAPDANLYPVTGHVSISLDKAPIKVIEGAGAKEGTSVSFCTEYMTSNLSLTNIASLTVSGGTLQPAALTAWDREKINLCITENGTLDLSGQGNVEVNNFTGGGKLILDLNSVIRIAGDLTGKTAFETNGGLGGNSGLAVKDHLYIEAKPEATGIFTFVPYPTQSDLALVRQSDGSWIMQTAPGIYIMYDTGDSQMGDVNINWEFIQSDTGSPEGAIAEPEPGYHFVNWTDEEGNEVSKDVHFIPQQIDGVYVENCYIANFDVNSYEVVYEPNGGSGSSMAGQHFTYLEKQKLQANTYVREGYLFNGWNTRPDGSGTQFTDQQEVSNLTVEQDGQIILYAQWTEAEKPTESNTPAPSVKPTEPATPTPSVKPSEPATPTPSVKPSEPATPTPSVKPTEPASPTPSVRPTEPATPTPSVRPTEPVPPTASDKPVTNSKKNTSPIKITAKSVLSKTTVKLKGKRKCVLIKFKKVKGAKGYEIYRSLKKKKGYKKIAVIHKTTYKNVRLKSKKKYYYKVRAYRKVKGKKIYSAFSKVKAVKTK